MLANVFENFRELCIKNYGLDQTLYFTAPGLAWDAMLKITKISLELIIDPDIALMIDKEIRGGVSMISTRYGKANNPYLKDYNTNLPTTYIEYVDANNLYGVAMIQKLPFRGFRWVTQEELSNWRGMPCILEVDLRYPEHLHDLHNDYPLAPRMSKWVGFPN